MVALPERPQVRWWPLFESLATDWLSWIDPLPSLDGASSNNDNVYYQSSKITVFALIRGPGNGLVLHGAHCVGTMNSSQLEIVLDYSKDMVGLDPTPECGLFSASIRGTRDSSLDSN